MLIKFYVSLLLSVNTTMFGLLMKAVCHREVLPSPPLQEITLFLILLHRAVLQLSEMLYSTELSPLLTWSEWILVGGFPLKAHLTD